MDLEEIAELKNNYLQEMFNTMHFSEEECELIINLNSFRYFKKGTSLLKNGQFSETSFFVIKGCLVSYIKIEEDEKVTDFYAEGDLFSSSCSLTNKPSTSYLVCLEDTLVSIGNPENEKIILDNFPRFEKLCRIETEKSLLEQKLAFDQFKFASPEERYIHFANTKPSLLQRVSQYQIASYLGLTPQSLSRIRKRLLNTQKQNVKIAV
jgi:CRP-like cAMP-binding protein